MTIGPDKQIFYRDSLSSSSVIQEFYYSCDFEILQQCRKKVKTKSQKILRSEEVWRSYKRKRSYKKIDEGIVIQLLPKFFQK